MSRGREVFGPFDVGPDPHDAPGFGECEWCGEPDDHEPREECDPRAVAALTDELRDEDRMHRAGL